MTATRLPPRQTATTARPVPALLLELAYRLHATKAVKRPPAARPAGCPG